MTIVTVSPVPYKTSCFTLGVGLHQIRNIIDLLNYLGLLHLLPEVNEEMDTALDELLNKEQDYPFANFIVCIGFLIVLIIEHVVLSCTRNKQNVEMTDSSCRCETIVRSGLAGVAHVIVSAIKYLNSVKNTSSVILVFLLSILITGIVW